MPEYRINQSMLEAEGIVKMKTQEAILFILKRAGAPIEGNFILRPAPGAKVTISFDYETNEMVYQWEEPNANSR